MSSDEVTVSEVAPPVDETKQEEVKEEPLVATARGALPLDWTRVQPPAQQQARNDEEGHDEGHDEEDHDEDDHDEDDHSEGPASIIRYPWQVADIDKKDEELVIVGTAGQKVTRIGLDLAEHCASNLKQLVLRSHLIRTMEGLSGFKELELLELYDNMVDVLQGLDEGENGAPGITLRVLDMSYNVIRDMAPVRLCPNLRELYLANNKLKSMAGLRGLSQLVKIDLGANRIRVMEEEELSGMVNLEELWLGKNKIEEIQGLEKLTKLRRLDVQSNRLTSVENLTTQVDTLEELYLAHNGIDDEGASQSTGLALPFTQLSTLDLSRNLLTSGNPFEHLTCLDDLWLSGNKIETFDAIQPLSKLTGLDGIYLEYNPVANEFEYRKKLEALIPSLTQIDANLIGGLAAHGIPLVSMGGAAETVEDQMRRFQNMAVERARNQTNQEEKL